MFVLIQIADHVISGMVCVRNVNLVNGAMDVNDLVILHASVVIDTLEYVLYVLV